MDTENRKAISAIILAAGSSCRMGFPKLLLPLGGKAIIQHTMDAFLCSNISEIIIVIGNLCVEVIGKMAAKNLKIVINNNREQGMSESINAGIISANQCSSGYMIALADQPFITEKTIDRIITAFNHTKKGIIVPYYKGKRGHPVLFSAKYKNELMLLKGDVGARGIIEIHAGDVLKVNIFSSEIHDDIDSIEDYKRYSKYFK